MQSAQFQLHAEIEQRHWWFVARRKILRRLIRQVVPPGATVVDVGCGTGANLAALACEYDCVGLDTSAEAVELAKSRFSGPRFIHASSPDDFCRAISKAQLVLLTDVLEHVSDDFDLLSSVLAAVQPGAHVLITVPADMTLWSPHDESFGHFRRYDLARFQQTWQDLPVRTRLLSHFNTRLYPLVKTVRAVTRRRRHCSGAAGTDFQLPAAPINWLLERTFAAEVRRLSRLLEGRTRRNYRRGVSLIAILQREPGAIRPRVKPPEVEPDWFQPIEVELAGTTVTSVALPH